MGGACYQQPHKRSPFSSVLGRPIIHVKWQACEFWSLDDDTTGHLSRGVQPSRVGSPQSGLYGSLDCSSTFLGHGSAHLNDRISIHSLWVMMRLNIIVLKFFNRCNG